MLDEVKLRGLHLSSKHSFTGSLHCNIIDISFAVPLTRILFTAGATDGCHMENSKKASCSLNPAMYSYGLTECF